jgi:hypothetical protein
MSLEKRLILRNGRAEYKHGEKGKKKEKESRMRGQSGGSQIVFTIEIYSNRKVMG